MAALTVIEPPPANDQFAEAIILTDGMLHEMDTAAATSTGDPIPTCQTNFGKGVWFTYTPSVDGEVMVSSCESSFDTVIQVYTGTAEVLTPVADGCNAGHGPACPTNSQASVTFSAQAGTVYHVLAGGFAGASGTLRIGVFTVPTPPTRFTIGTFTLDVLSYENYLYDPSAERTRFVNASGYATTTLSCDSHACSFMVHFENLAIEAPSTPGLWLATAGKAYPTTTPVLAGAVEGFDILFDSLDLLPSQATAQIRLRFPPGLIAATNCGPPELSIGLVTITASAACDFYTDLPTLAYGPWIVGDTGIVIQGTGITVDFSTSWSPTITPPVSASWRGVVLGAGATVPASGAVTSNLGYLQAPYSFAQGLVTATGFSGLLSLSASPYSPYEFQTAQPLNYGINLTAGTFTLMAAPSPAANSRTERSSCRNRPCGACRAVAPLRRRTTP